MSEADFDEASIMAIVRGAECSVGAFYGRFGDKQQFLLRLIDRTFDDEIHLITENLSEKDARTSASADFKKLVDLVSERFATRSLRGVVRCSIKLGMTEPKALAPFIAYRNAVTEKAIELVAPEKRHLRKRAQVREAVQIMLCLLTDAALVDGQPMKPGRDWFKAVVLEVIQRHLQSSKKSKSAGGSE